jgi:triacylglycerol lipase
MDGLLIVLVVLLVLALGLALVLVVRHLLREARHPPLPRAPLRPGLPVVLAHGLLGFDEMQVAEERYEYFRGVARMLQRLGAEVHRPRVPPVASVAARAACLAEYIKQIPRPVNLVAHSMGGLDARYALSHLDLGNHVATLTTIGTPHHGTPLADMGSTLLERLGIRRLLRFFGLEIEAFFDLSSARARELNRQVDDEPGVSYFSIVGVVPEASRVHPLLAAPQLYLQRTVGANDGLVPRESQIWGEVLAELRADHFAQIGWSRHFNALAIYRDLLRELRDRGF